MKQIQINTETDFLTAVTDAMREGDIATLDDIAHQVRGHLQEESHTEAQIALIHAAIELIELA